MAILRNDKYYFEDALDEFNKSIAIERKDYFSWYNIGIIYLRSPYGFDVLTEEGWILYTFMVEEAPGHELDIYVYGSSVKDDSGYLPDPYTAMYIFQPGTYMTGDEFWSYIYPPMDYEEAV